MYDVRLVETICRKYQGERDSHRAEALMGLLQAVVTEDQSEIGRRLTCIIDEFDTMKPSELRNAN